MGRSGADHLRTSRLCLSPPSREDAEAVLAIHRDPRTCAHNPSDQLDSQAGAEALVGRWVDHWERYGFGYWVVRLHGDDAVIGFCGAKRASLSGREVANLFYRFHPRAWGRGLATEAARAVVARLGRHHPDLPLVARVRPANLASQQVAIRCGLERAEHLDTVGEDGLDWIWTLEPATGRQPGVER